MQMRTSQYLNPYQTEGQHTNGPPNIFVREDDSQPWYLVLDCKHKHKVRKMAKELGFESFIRQHCEAVE
jgi:hypothetical protein